MNWPQAVRFVGRRTYHAGQRLIFTFSDPSYSSATFVLRLIYNRDPRLSVFTPHPQRIMASVGPSPGAV